MTNEYDHREIPNEGESDLVLVVRQTVTVTTRVPITKAHYPDEKTVGEALDYERNLPMPEKIQSFVEAIESAGAGGIDFGETITVEARGQS